MHSALLVGLLSAKMMGLSLKLAISLMISSVKAPATAAAPGNGDIHYSLTYCKYYIQKYFICFLIPTDGANMSV